MSLPVTPEAGAQLLEAGNQRYVLHFITCQPLMLTFWGVCWGWNGRSNTPLLCPWWGAVAGHLLSMLGVQAGCEYLLMRGSGSSHTHVLFRPLRHGHCALGSSVGRSVDTHTAPCQYDLAHSCNSIVVLPALCGALDGGCCATMQCMMPARSIGVTL